MHKWPAVAAQTIVVINVRKKNKKTLKNAFFILKIKNVNKRDKKRYHFLLAFDVEPVDKMTDIN